MKERPSPSNREAMWRAGREYQRELERKRKRRLRGGIAFAIASMVPWDVTEGLVDVLRHEPPKPEFTSHQPEKSKSIEEIIAAEKQRTLDDAIAAIQKNLRDPAVLEALEGRGEDPLRVIFSAVEIPILPEHLEGTSYDVGVLHQQYPIQIERRIEKRRLLGNSVSWGDGSLLTTAHFSYGSSAEQYPVSDIDVDFVPKDGGIQTKNIGDVIAEDPTLTDADIHGRPVSIVGVDIKHKTYPGVAVKVTLGLARRLSRNPQEIERLLRSFMLILPPGEAKPDTDAIGDIIAADSGEKIPLRAQGMSGSPMFVYREGRYTFGGVFWGIEPVDIGDRTVEVGFVHGIDEVRQVQQMKALQAHK